MAHPLAARGVGFRSLTEQIDTTTSGGMLVFNIFGSLSASRARRAAWPVDPLSVTERNSVVMILDAGLQRRAQVGLNKGEAHHALKNRRRLSPPVRGRNGSCYGAAGRVAADGLLEA